MNLVARFPKLTALAFTLLMLAPIVPTGGATHTSPLVPDLPALPKPHAGDECIQTALPATALDAVRAASALDTSYFAELDGGVPGLCDASGRKLIELAPFLAQADAVLENLRNVTREAQRQADQRTETTLPEGNIVRPRFTLLEDRFDGKRVGGFGDWAVISEKGEPDAFRLEQVPDVNGTRGTYRFGNASGYERGIHQWLVSPEIDLTAANGNASLAKYVASQKLLARNQLYNLCNQFAFPAEAPVGVPGLQPQPGANSPLAPVCGQRANVVGSLTGSISIGDVDVPTFEETRLARVIEAYQSAFDAVTDILPVAQETAFVNLTYRHNLATGIDGVRVWIYTGDHQPTRTDLFGDTLGQKSTSTSCSLDIVDGASGQAVVTGTRAGNAGRFFPDCSADYNGAVPITGLLPGNARTQQFQNGVALPSEDLAITGDRAGFATARVNLTNWTGERVWLLFEVKTRPDIRGDPYFTDPGYFPRQEAYGFELAAVNATAEGYLRNFRLKDVAANMPLIPSVDFAGDDLKTTRTTLPPGDTPVVIRVHNAGQQVENGTLTVAFGTKSSTRSASNVFHTTTVKVPLVKPGEARDVVVPWPQALRERVLYHVDATLAVEGGVSGVTVNNATRNADPNVTQVRVPNAPGILSETSALNGSADVRAYTKRELGAVRADGSAGMPLQVCKDAKEAPKCEDFYKAAKGDARVIMLGVRNDGSLPEDATAVLTVKLDGIVKDSIILDGAAQQLRDLRPGEVRAVTWTVAPTEVGAYDLSIALQLPRTTKETHVTGVLYVGRSTGLLCYDDLQAQRECGSAFALTQPDELKGRDLTAVTLSPAGDLVVATEVDEVHGIIAARTSEGWIQLANISNASLTQAGLEAPGASRGMGFGSIRSMTYDAAGDLILVGDNLTALLLDSAGVLRPVHVAQVPMPMRVITGGASLIAELNTTHALMGGVVGGSQPVAFEWQTTSVPSADAGVSYSDATLAHTAFSANRTGNYTLTLRTTDAAGATASSSVQIIVIPVRALNETLNPPAKVSARPVGAEAIRIAWEPLEGTSLTYRVERAYDGEGPWIVVAETSTPAFTDAGLVSRRPYEYRVSTLSPDGKVSLPSNKVAAAAEALFPQLRATAAYNGTFYAAGDESSLLQLNKTDPQNLWLHRVNVTFPQCKGTTEAEKRSLPLDFRYHALARFSGELYAAGDSGHVFALGPLGPRAIPTEDGFVPPLSGGKPETCPGGELRTIRALTPYVESGIPTLIAAGDDNLVEILVADRFNLTFTPPGLGREPDHAFAYVDNEGHLTLVGTDGVAYSCVRCFSDAAIEWSMPALPIPSIVEDKVPRRVEVTGALSQAGVTTLVGEGAAILDFAFRGAATNGGDWTTLPSLTPRDGGAWVTRKPTDGSVSSGNRGLRGTFADGADMRTGATEYKVSLTHHVWATEPDSRLYLRALYLPFPSYQVTAVGNTCPRTPNVQGNADERGAPFVVGTACRGGGYIVQDIALFDNKTPISGWERYTSPTFAAPEPNLFLAGVELYRERAALWAVDDILVQGRIDNEWKPLLWWYGPDDHDGNTWAQSIGNIPVVETSTSQWEIATEAAGVFSAEGQSAWHLSYNLADRPVWVANDELYADSRATPATPHLRDNWDTRLITPILDLGLAFDPVVSFRHAYSFRTLFQPPQNPTDQSDITIGDVGFLEIQYLLQGPEECPGGSATTTCGWSRWHRVTPDGGYPNATGAGFPEGVVADAIAVPDRGMVGHNRSNSSERGLSWWGHNVQPDRSGTLVAARDTANYEQVDVTLARLTCKGVILEPGCLNVTFAGRQIRLAFHIETADAGSSVFNFDDPDVDGRPSVGGEGWYVTDLKVRGSAELGMNLIAENLHPDVGYDVARIGVGPGTKVPIAVDVRNNGTFEVPGYRADLEVRLVTDALAKKSILLETVSLDGLQPVLEPGKTRHHAFEWSVPTAAGLSTLLRARGILPEGAELAESDMRFILAATVTPEGIDLDEDPTNNVARYGSYLAPLPARTHKDFAVEFTVTPENATTEFTRYVPLYLKNTGNVPLSGFKVFRYVMLKGGTAGNGPAVDESCGLPADDPVRLDRTIVEVRCFITDSAVKEGTRASLAEVASTLVPDRDFVWKPQAPTDFKLYVTASNGELSNSSQRIVTALATFLFDDVDAGATGDAIRGEWTPNDSWNESFPGFGSPKSYAFGDAAAGRYPGDADASFVTPTLDLSNARSARLSFYHRYAFEPGFDAGVVEASVDGGKTWTRLQPLPDNVNGLPKGYNDTYPLAASSPLHPDGNPDHLAYGFTGDSTVLPNDVEDGWVLSTFDLSEFANVTEPDVAYYKFDSVELKGFTGLGVNDSVDNLGRPSNSYADKSWIGTGDFDLWERYDLTQDTVVPKAGSDFWWSGSASLLDDGVRPISNNKMTFELDLTGYTQDDGQSVRLEWWEWVDRYHGGLVVHNEYRGTTLQYKDLDYGVGWGTSSWPTAAWRYNVTPPQILERDGRWFHMQSDMSSYKGQKVSVSFVYAPLKNEGTLDAASKKSPEAMEADLNTAMATDSNYVGNLLDDRGFVIDGLHLYSVGVVNGQVTPPQTIKGESDFTTPAFTDCDRQVRFNAEFEQVMTSESDRNNAKPACYRSEGGVNYPMIEYPILRTGKGYSWTLVDRLPGVPSNWTVVDVRDHENYNAERRLPTGEVPRAWYTGGIEQSCIAPGCVRPGSESRLVTPAVDLGRVSGADAYLTFWHRYAFTSYMGGTDWLHPLASGGVVEIQEYDPDTRTWSDWHQIYARPDNFTLGPRGMNKATVATDGEKNNTLGGYSGYTVDATLTYAGEERRNDLSFERIYLKELDQNVTFLYTGKSSDIPTARPGGWVPARFDVSDYIGKQVRFGFHYAITGAAKSTVQTTYLTAPDSPTLGDHGGWWIGDIEVVGKVLKAEPVQLRFRAATDGTLQDGRWQLDEVGVYGARYQKNVGIFIAPVDGQYGAVPGQTVSIPVVIRNLGDSVRRDLILEVRAPEDTLGLRLSGDAPGGATMEGDVFRMRGFTLAAGQTRTVLVNVTVPEQPVGAGRNVDLLFYLKEKDPIGDGSVRITTNEVEGFLERKVAFNVTNAGRLDLLRIASSPALPEVGEPITFRVDVKNSGPLAFGLDVACSVHLVDGHAERDHGRSQPDELLLGKDFPCEKVDGPDRLEPRQAATLVYRVTPDTAGFLRFRLTGHIVDGRTDAPLSDLFQASAVVGMSPLLLSAGFDAPRDVQDNWTAASARGSDPGQYGPPLWAYLQGHDRQGALLVGMNESLEGIADYNVACTNQKCRAISPPVDLHNFTADESVYLTLWHMDKLANFDGANVKAQILDNERQPNNAGSWDPVECVIRPVGDYEGRVRSVSVAVPGQDQPVWSSNSDRVQIDGFSEANYFNNSFFETAWTRSAFDLSAAPLRDTDCNRNEETKLIGKTVRFLITTYTGQSNQALMRGNGIGILVDDVSVSTQSITVGPKGQRALLVDNTTKAFNLVVTNDADYPDLVRITYDEGNSSAPAGTIVTPREPVALAPNETRSVPVLVTLPRDPSLLPTLYKARVVAESLIDRNAFGETTLDLQFGPRQWPELSLRAEAPTGSVQVGTEAYIPVTVENTGLVASPQTRIMVIDRWTGGVAYENLTVTELESYFEKPDESSLVVPFNWRPAEGSLGVHTLTFVLDPDARLEEYTRGNNLQEISVQVDELLVPDLDVGFAEALGLRNQLGGVVTGVKDADVMRYEVAAGELVGFELKVRNTGRAAATNVDVRAFVGALSLPPKSVAYIAPDSEVTVTFNWLAQKGEHSVAFLVGTDQFEPKTDNNRNPGTGVTLLTVKGFEVAVEISALEGIFEPDTDVKMPFKLTNGGIAGEDIVLKARGPAGVVIDLPREAMFLRAGDTYEGIAVVHLPDDAVAGEQFISIEAVARENPMKVATGSSAIRVNATYAGAVVPALAVSAPPEMAVPILLRNEGNSLEPWSLTVKLPAGWRAKEAMPLQVSVPAHGVKEVLLQVVVPDTTAPGVRMLDAKATLPDGQVREASLRVDVLSHRAASVKLAAEDPKPAAGALAFPVVVENKGNVKQPFQMVLTQVPDGVVAKVEPSTFDLPPGGKAVASLLVTPNATLEGGVYPVVAYTMFNGVFPDTPEGRANVQALQVSVVRPDLRAASLDYAPRSDVAVGARVTIKVPLQNHGDAAASDVPVHLFVDDVFVAEARVPHIAAGGKGEVTLNWTALPGRHTLTAVVDPYKDTVDGNVEDNAVSALIEVGSAVPVGGQAAGRADTPAPGMLAALVAVLAAAMLALPSRRRPPR